MTADLLRRAAAKIRENAEAATPGPWFTTDEGNTHPGAFTDVGSKSVRVTSDCCSYQGTSTHADAEHIASWHPGVALDVADLLDFAAEAFFADVRAASNIEHIAGMPMPARCIAVARAYLGEDA